MKAKWILTIVAVAVMASSLSGCIVVPARGYYGGGYYHDHDHDRGYYDHGYYDHRW